MYRISMMTSGILGTLPADLNLAHDALAQEFIANHQILANCLFDIGQGLIFGPPLGTNIPAGRGKTPRIPRLSSSLELCISCAINFGFNV